MDRKDIGTTKVWKIDKTLVVAPTIEEAVELYQSLYDFPYNRINIIEAVRIRDYISDDSIAYIKIN